MRARSFSHVGITVANFGAAVRFYSDVFGCRLVGVSETPAERVISFFGVEGDDPRCRIGWLRVPGGAVLEIFEFQPQRPGSPARWDAPGLTHVGLNVRDIHAWHRRLLNLEVECLGPPEQSPHGHWFLFARDPDGNLVELIKLGRMHPALKYLGPLGGAVFRRTIYRRYYR